jgi:hypothetical protein
MSMPVGAGGAARAVHDGRGQSVTEFGLVLPVLLIVLLVGVDAGRLFFGWVNLQNASRIAANYAATNPAGPFVAGSPYETTVKRETAGINCASLTIPPPTFTPNTDVGSTAKVTLSCSFSLVMPFVGPLPLGATSTFPVRSGHIAGVPQPPDPPCDPPKIAVISYIGLTVGQARDAWTALGGIFSPSSGHNGQIVTGQVPLPHTCVSAGATMTVVYE